MKNKKENLKMGKIKIKGIEYEEIGFDEYFDIPDYEGAHFRDFSKHKDYYFKRMGEQEKIKNQQTKKDKMEKIKFKGTEYEEINLDEYFNLPSPIRAFFECLFTKKGRKTYHFKRMGEQYNLEIENLKTLGEIEEKVIKGDWNWYAVETDNLRQEAIRDIKFLENFEDDGNTAFFIGEANQKKPNYRKVIINYIKWKFNITEEDLK